MVDRNEGRKLVIDVPKTERPPAKSKTAQEMDKAIEGEDASKHAADVVRIGRKQLEEGE